MREAIRGYADAELEDASAHGELGQLADELDSVRRALAGSDDLRRVLTDPGVTVGSRRGVLTSLLEAQVDARTLRLLLFPVEADRATDYSTDVTWLADRAQAAARGSQPLTDVLLGRTAAAERIDGYATSVLASLSGGSELDDIEDELFRFMRVVDGSPELRTALTSRDVEGAARRRLVTALLEGKARPATIRLASYATQVGRPRDYLDQLELLVARVAEENDRRLAEVVSAVELDEEQQQRLAVALTRATGRRTEVRVTVDSSLLGGFVVNVGDTIVDASVRHRLDRIKDRLTLPEATITTTGESS